MHRPVCFIRTLHHCSFCTICWGQLQEPHQCKVPSLVAGHSTPPQLEFTLIHYSCDVAHGFCASQVDIVTPGGKTISQISIPPPADGWTEATVEFRVLLAANKSWAQAGHKVCFLESYILCAVRRYLCPHAKVCRSIPTSIIASGIYHVCHVDWTCK